MKRDLKRLERDVRKLALPNGRTVGSAGHEKVREYLLGRLAELSISPYGGDSFCLEYRQGGTRFDNLIGVVKGSDRRAAPILVGAHYESVIPAACADDNAAAVAIGLFVAERLKRSNMRRDVVIALFDADERHDGWTILPSGERLYYISNPALGLWAARSRMEA